MIGIIDYGSGNLRSVYNAFRYLDVAVKVSDDPAVLAKSDKLVFPGVGSSGDAMKELSQRGLTDTIKDHIESGRPFLGICLGLQLLFTESSEGAGCGCLDIVPGKVRLFPSGKGLKIPQIGWNTVDIKKTDCPIFNGIDNNSYFYFVHSYYCDASDKQYTAGVTEYGVKYTSALWKDNIFALQLHPERSQEKGLKILENFSRL